MSFEYFKTVMRSKADVDLIDIHKDYRKYTLDALKACSFEAKNRKMDIENIDEVETWINNLELQKFENKMFEFEMPELKWDDSSVVNEVIKEKKLFRLEVIVKKRVHSKTLIPVVGYSLIRFPTLCIFTDKNVPNGLESLKKDRSWMELAIGILTITFFNLFQTGAISVMVFRDEYSYFKFIQSYKESLSIRVNTNDKTGDFLSDLILDILQHVKFSTVPSFDFATVLKMILNDRIGREKMHLPEKKFVIKALELYAEKLDYVDLVRTKSKFGLISNYSLNVRTKEKAELQSHYEKMMKTANKAANFDAFFLTRISEHIRREFFKRTESD